MGMSYRRAWLLAKTMNACFQRPLIEAAKGGIGGGGARLIAWGARFWRFIGLWRIMPRRRLPSTWRNCAG
jgi:molybdate transport system regulatory protein